MGLSRRIDQRLPALLAAVGLLTSLVLEGIHLRAYLAPAASSVCTVGARIDCLSVTLSRYAVLFGLPLPIWGALGFLALFVAAWRRSIWLVPLSAVAALASVGLLAIELFAIGAVCLFCEIVHVTSWVLLGVALRRRTELVRDGWQASTWSYVFAPVVGLGAALMLLLPRYWGAFTFRGDVPFASGVTPKGYPWLGAAHPKLEVQEFSDYLCPHCRVLSSRILAELARHPDQIRLVRRQNPRMRCHVGGEFSCVQARAAYCAQEQGRFWQMDRWLFAHASNLRLDWARAAADVKLDEGRLKRCMARPDVFARIDDEVREARKLKLAGTPGYTLNGRRVALTDLERRLAELE
ncbi:MAG: thioredoxin domain-containing protein [Polyangiaceae bacterium]|nr:thioredoxin domain-containing protein [Polyangiaceae bacterium]